MDDEVVKLILDAQYESVQRAQVVIQATSKDVYDFSDSYEVLELEEKRVAAATGQVTEANKQLAVTVVNLTEEEKRLTRAMEEQARASQSATKASTAFGVAGVNVSTIMGQSAYAVGDFASASGDLGSKLMAVSNNVQFAAAQFGPWGMAVGVGITLTASLIKNWDTLDRAFKEKVAIPEAADNIERMNDALDRTEKRIKELNKLESLTVAEGKEYNKLLQDRHELEEKITEEKKKQKDLKAFNELKSKAESEEEKERSNVLQEGIGGHQGRATGQLSEAMRRAAEKRMAVLAGRAARAKGKKRKQIEAEMRQMMPLAESSEANYGFAEEMMTSAVMHGSKDDTNTILQYMAESPTAFDQHTMQAFGAAAPGVLKTKKQRDAEKKAKQDADKKAKDEAAAAKKAADAAAKQEKEEDDFLNQQVDESGREMHQARMRREAKQRKADADEKRRLAAEHKEDTEFGERTGLTDQAAYRMAELVQQGYRGDVAGRTQHELAQHLGRTFNMAPELASRRAAHITGAAQKNDSEKYEAAYSQAIANGANVNQAMIYANQQILQTLAEANARFTGQAGQLRSQGRRAASMRVRGRSFAPIGGGEG